MARRLLFVGREGALVERGAAPGRIDKIGDLRLVQGVLPALLRLAGAGYEIVVLDDASPGVPNASPEGPAASPDAPDASPDGPAPGASPDGPAGSPPVPAASRTGADSSEDVDRFLEALFASQGVPLAAILRCGHSELERCDCRKPRLGLVREYLGGNAMDRDRSAVVGDSAVDLELGANMGLRGFSLAEVRWPDVAHALLDRPRVARVRRRTRETDIEIEVDLDREAEPRAATGIGFFDHMLEQLGKHSAIALTVACRGDLEIDEHHTVEDVALALGQALREALGDKRGIGRYGFVLPMDEAEAEVSLDLGGRPYLVFDGAFGRERVGELPTELVPHFFRSVAETLGAAVHVKVRGENAHHMVESAFKGFARALRQACARSGDTLPSTKGVL